MYSRLSSLAVLLIRRAEADENPSLFIKKQIFISNKDNNYLGNII